MRTRIRSPMHDGLGRQPWIRIWPQAARCSPPRRRGFVRWPIRSTSDFGRAVDLLAGAAGRVVVSGMGKSGPCRPQDRRHPRLHRHPGAVRPPGRGLARRPRHGGAGRCACWRCPIPARPPELADLIAPRRAASACRWSPSPARAAARWPRAADVVLVLPAAREACPMGLAPTTSTTMQMALGDALAVALLTRRGFGRRISGSFHPGGRLGARLRRVRDLMHDGRRDAAGDPGRGHGRGAAGDDGEALRLPRHRARGRAAGRHRHRRRPAPRHGPRPARAGGWARS